MNKSFSFKFSLYAILIKDIILSEWINENNNLFSTPAKEITYILIILNISLIFL